MRRVGARTRGSTRGPTPGGPADGRCARPVRGEDRLDGRHIGWLAVHHHEVPRRGVVLRREVAGHDGGLGAVDRDGLLMEDLRVIRPGHGDAGRGQGRVRRLVDRSPAVVVVEEDPDPDAPLVVGDQNLLRRRVRQLVHRHVETLPGRGHEVVERCHAGLRLDQQRESRRRRWSPWSGWPGWARRPW